MLILLILTLTGPNGSSVDVPAGVLASRPLCHMAARGIGEALAEEGPSDVAFAYRCEPQGTPA